jgi:hypothetical protein
MKLVDSDQKSTIYAIVETEIIDSNHPDYEPGVQRSQVIDLGHASGFGNLRAVIECLEGGEVDDDEIEDLAEEYFSDDSPGIGRKAIVQAEQVPTRKGGVFTKHLWFEADEDQEVLDQKQRKRKPKEVEETEDYDEEETEDYDEGEEDSEAYDEEEDFDDEEEEDEEEDEAPRRSRSRRKPPARKKRTAKRTRGQARSRSRKRR